MKSKIETVLYYEGRDIREMEKDELVQIVRSLYETTEKLTSELADRCKMSVGYMDYMAASQATSKSYV
jgi:hypothetical protein